MASRNVLREKGADLSGAFDDCNRCVRYMSFRGAVRKCGCDPQNAGIQSYSLVPFRTIRAYFRAYSDATVNTSVVIENLLGNFLLFAPMGAVAPFFLDILRERRYFCAFTLLGLCMVEFLQFVTGRGSMDIDDVILNLAGAVLFHLLFLNKRAEAFWDKAGLIEDEWDVPLPE